MISNVFCHVSSLMHSMFQTSSMWQPKKKKKPKFWNYGDQQLNRSSIIERELAVRENEISSKYMCMNICFLVFFRSLAFSFAVCSFGFLFRFLLVCINMYWHSEFGASRWWTLRVLFINEHSANHQDSDVYMYYTVHNTDWV